MKLAPIQVERIDYMGSDLSVVNAARVSFSKESWWDEATGFDGRSLRELSAADQKLISYLARHNHWTPFAHAFISYRIKAPIFVARQLIKHQVGLAWNEVSRRYVDDEPELWFPKEWRGKPVNAKQGSSGVVKLSGRLVEAVYESARQDLAIYNELLGEGVAPEQARMVLPQNMMTEWIWSGSLAAFARVCKLRLDPHAQAETAEVAGYIARFRPEVMKHSWEALSASPA